MGLTCNADSKMNLCVRCVRCARLYVYVCVVADLFGTDAPTAEGLPGPNLGSAADDSIDAAMFSEFSVCVFLFVSFYFDNAFSLVVHWYLSRSV